MSAESDSDILLYGYWRSSSAYRVRIALNLKGIPYRQAAVHLVRDGGQQNRPDYRAVNPLGLVPALVHGDLTLVQSMAICEYLEETFPDIPLLPPDASGRARVRGLVQTVCSEIQPLNNLGVTKYLEQTLELPGHAVRAWYSNWIARGFSALEAWLRSAETGQFCHGDEPTLADCFLVPQVYNAERFECDLEPYPNIRRITGHCRALPAFDRAAPENQPDAA
ncbi:MAG: maleylacetoacetate isomerase [Xanthomonadales bacterium]|nr:maleylacetoacetate isomerase [Xanthomonadales bacterium]